MEAEKRSRMNWIADLHTHTLVSDHAFNTITEMAHAAAEKGLWAIAVTDHGPAMPDSPHRWYFYTIQSLPEKMEGVWVLKGVEANIVDAQGTIDFSQRDLGLFHFDWMIASLHSDVVPPTLTRDECTQLWMNVAANPHVDMIGHSETPAFPYDYNAVAKEFAAHGKVVEVNANSCVARPGGENNLRELIIACKKADVKIAVTSDAHSIYHLGGFDSVLPVLEQVDYPRELIINAEKKTLVEELKRHGKAIAQRMEEEL